MLRNKQNDDLVVIHYKNIVITSENCRNDEVVLGGNTIHASIQSGFKRAI